MPPHPLQGWPSRAPRTGAERAAALGTEPVGRLLWHACSQTTVSVGVYGVYALTNAWFVARGVGAVAFAAVNLVAPVLLIVGAVATTVGAGGASLVSRSLGRGDPAGAARATGNAFLLFWITAVGLGAGGALLLGPLLTLLGATAATRGYGYDYGLIVLVGAVTGTGFSSLVRAEGRMRFSTMLWVVPVLTQIALDPLLIFGCGLGVRGAALGTIGGQAVSMGMSLWFFFLQSRRPYRVTAADLRPHAATMRQLVAVGAPSLLTGLGATLVVALANNLLVAAGGALAVSAFALCARIGTFVAMPQTGIAQGLQPVVGYNAGLGGTARVDRATTLALRATVCYGGVVCLLLLVLADPLVGLFTDDPGLRARATGALRIIALSYPFAGIAPLLCARFQALGQPRPSYWISVGGVVVIKAPLLVVLGRFGDLGLWISFPVAELVTAGLALRLLHRGRFSAGPPADHGCHRAGWSTPGCA